MQAPSWLLYLEVFALILMPVLTLVGSAGLRVLWGMRQELTVLTVEMQQVADQKQQISELWMLVRSLESQLTEMRAVHARNGKR